jgi:hypothetical protein
MHTQGSNHQRSGCLACKAHAPGTPCVLAKRNEPLHADGRQLPEWRFTVLCLTVA